MHILIKDAKDHIQESVTIRGWMYNKRGSGKIYFLQLRDGSGFLQATVAEGEAGEKAMEAARTLTIESSLTVEGIVSPHPKRTGEYELKVKEISIIQQPETDYPIGKKDHGPDFLLDQRHLWLRSSSQWAIQRVRDCVIRAVYAFFHERGFVKVDTPIITPSACEGSTDLFAIEYFDQGRVYLSQSGQLYLEAAIMSLGRGFDFGPTFRAEKSKTRRHLTEFWMMDAEAAFMEHAESMRLQEDMVAYIVGRVLAECRPELALLERDPAPLEGIKTPFPRLTYTEAIDKLRQMGSDIKFGEDLGNDDEGLLTQDSPLPVFIHKWPAEIKPFYMKRDPGNPALALNDDMIGIEGSGELIGGSQREDDYETLKKRIEEEGLDMKEYEWYLDLRRYGSVPHSGFGLGLERMVRWLCCREHIRETIPFPRLLNRVTP